MKTVLIIDDEADYRYLLAEFLRQNGWDILEAADADSGIAAARAHKPELIICDVSLPGTNGFDICRRLRSDPALDKTGILISSGRDPEENRQIALDAGADEYVPKPFEPGGLLRAAANHARRASNTPKPDIALKHAKPANWLQFWGVRGSIPTPGPSTVRYGGNTSCVEVRADGEIIILDAGSGLRLLGKQLAAEFEGRPPELTLLLSHTHWDHIQGLPFFPPLHVSGSRLRVVGYQGARRGLQSVLSSQMESPFFPIAFNEAAAEIQIDELRDLQFSVGSVRVHAFLARHPGTCVGYRLFASSGSVAFLPDNESRSPDATANGNPDCDLVEFVRGTDLLILDSQYDCVEYSQHVGWGHGCVDDAVAVALEAKVKRLFLFHHDPDHDDATIQSMVAHARTLVAARGGQLEVDAAREGLRVDF